MIKTYRLPQKLFVILFILLLKLTSFADQEIPGLRDCKTKKDCIMIDINCGEPGTVSRKFKKYSDNPQQTCRASMNFKQQKKNLDLACLEGKCTLVPKNK